MTKDELTTLRFELTADANSLVRARGEFGAVGRRIHAILDHCKPAAASVKPGPELASSTNTGRITGQRLNELMAQNFHTTDLARAIEAEVRGVSAPLGFAMPRHVQNLRERQEGFAGRADYIFTKREPDAEHTQPIYAGTGVSDAAAKALRELRAFHDFFRDRCEGLFQQWGWPVIDLYNAAYAALSAPEVPNPGDVK